LQTQGTQGVALAYVTRVNVAVLPHTDDPSTNYSSIKLEMISRCPHGTMAYSEDSKEVWSILQRDLSKTLSFSLIRRQANVEDGRAAYLDIDQNYCGRSKVENILEKVEGDIASTYYSEDKVNFTFETYVAIHGNTFNEMSKADNYTAPDGATIVRVLLSNISSKCPTLCVVIASIRASPTLRGDFEDAVDQLNTEVARTNMGKKNNRIIL